MMMLQRMNKSFELKRRGIKLDMYTKTEER